jgi:hypothetical protein
MQSLIIALILSSNVVLLLSPNPPLEKVEPNVLEGVGRRLGRVAVWKMWISLSLVIYVLSDFIG